MNVGWVRVSRLARMGAVCLLVAPLPAVPVHASVRRPSTPRTAEAGDARPAVRGFEANLGQTDPRARFLWRSADAALFVSPDELVVSLAEGGVVHTRFVGASSASKLEGVDRLAGQCTYLIGRDASRYVGDVPRFAGVRYRSLYPGIDLALYEGDAVEYDFVVAPGADAGRITLDFDASAHPKLEADGSLVLHARGGDVRHRAPRAYQSVDGVRRDVASRFVLDEHGRARFAIGPHDPSLPLVVDPILTTSTYLGGHSADRANGIALDPTGAIYVAGRTFSADYPTAAAYDDSNNGNYDVFVTKYAPGASAVVYSTYVGGADFDSAEGIAVTATGEAYVTGYTGSANFPLANAFQSDLAGGIDALVLHLNAAGTSLLLSTYLGGGNTDQGNGVAVSPAGDAFVVGETISTDLATTVDAIQPDYGGGEHDAFYAKISGDTLASLSYLGGLGDDVGNAVAVDANANVYVTGRAGALFPLLNPFQSSVGGTDAFVTKVNASLTSLAYSSYLGGSNTDIGTGIAVDTTGSAYVTGYTLSSNFPTTTPFQPTNGGNNDGFVAKVNAVGSAKVYSSYIGGSGDDRANAIAVDAAGSAWVVGQARSLNFPTLFPVQAANGGNQLNDCFVTKVGASGRIRIYSTYLGGRGTDVAYGVAALDSTTAYLVGYTDSTNYPLVAPIQAMDEGVDDTVLSSISEAGDTPGVVVTGTQAWFLRNSSSPGPADVTLTYGGSSSFVPLSGDWNGDGVDTPGLYDPATSTFFLRNSNTPGPANLAFTFGAPNVYVPITGDWNADGVDTIGIYNPATGTFFLRNTNSSGNADVGFAYGAPGAGLKPIVGDWNGDAADTIGLYDPVSGSWFLRDQNSAGPATYTFTFGPAGSLTPLAGDWNADGIDTPGLYDPTAGTWFLRNSLSPGPADLTFGYGPGGGAGAPVVGDWNG